MQNLIVQRKKQQGFSLFEFIIVMAIIGWLASVAIPNYQDYMGRHKWREVIASIAPLKLMMSECVNDSKGDITVCNSFSADKLGKYLAIKPMPNKYKNVKSISVLKNAAIRIIGEDELGKCVVDFVPSVQKIPDRKTGVIRWGLAAWQPIAQPSGEDDDTFEKCKTYVKGCG